MSKEQEGGKRRKVIFSLDSLNLIIAVSAVAISAASFVATYMQSDAAYRQVKAETWPYIQIDTGNVDTDRQVRIITYEVENAGVGPAHVKHFELRYQGQLIRSVPDLVKACCKDAIPADMASQSLEFTTDSPSPKIIPAGEDQLVFSLAYRDEYQLFWEAMDKARWQLEAKACYCSLLDECFETDFKAEPKPVTACKRDPETEYNG